MRTKKNTKESVKMARRAKAKGGKRSVPLSFKGQKLKKRNQNGERRESPNSYLSSFLMAY